MAVGRGGNLRVAGFPVDVGVGAVMAVLMAMLMVMMTAKFMC